MEISNILILNIINSGISLIMGLYMLFLYRNKLKTGTGYWASGSLVVGAGLLLRVYFPIDNSLYLIGTPVLLTIGLYLYLAGIFQFKEKRLPKWLIFGVPGLDFLQCLVFYYIFPNSTIRIGLHLFILIYYSLCAIYEMFQLKPEQKYLKNIFRINALSFLLFLVFLMLNIFVLIKNPQYSPTSSSEAAIKLHIISGFTMIALTFGFLSAVNIKLQKELTEQLKSNKKFLSIIAHDLRSPVGNMTNFLGLLQYKNELSEKKRNEYIKVLNILSQSTFHLLQNLLEWAGKSRNINEYKSERLEINKLIASNIDILKTSMDMKSIDLKLVEEKQSFINGDANMLETIFRNLVSNAVKYTPDGGCITITSEKSDKRVRLIVSDTGKGIKPEIIDSLFSFETNISTKGTNGERGSGLGLVLCKELVSVMNGTIHIQCRDTGTDVIVDFPEAE